MNEPTREDAMKWFEEVYKEEITLGDKSPMKIAILTAEGLKLFTPAQLLEEMRKGTEIGRLNLRIIQNYLKWKHEHEVMQK